MSKVLKIDKNVHEGVRELLRSFLENKKVKGVFALKKINENGAVAYSLITNPNMVEAILPFFPFMPANAGKLLSHLTLTGSLKGPIAAVVRPCELRAFVELVKREQGSLENFLFISSSCGGVYPLEKSVNGDLSTDSELWSKYWDGVKNPENQMADVRPTCKACEHFLPYSADMTVLLLGNKAIDTECKISLNTDKGEKFADGIEGEFIEEEIENEALKLFRNKRIEEKKRLFAESQIEKFGMDGLIKTFGRCIGCHGCSNICPICYCNLCTFDSRDYEWEPSTYETEIEKRGGIRVPPNTVFYHIGRLTHVGISCVGCGLCSDVCPADIPLSTIFLKVGESVQKVFDYLPGKDVEEAIPLTTFETEELTEVED